MTGEAWLFAFVTSPVLLVAAYYVLMAVVVCIGFLYQHLAPSSHLNRLKRGEWTP